MPSAFTSMERERILASLRQSARECAKTTGMKNLSVDELAKAAGISKGAFYKFYACKELLFLEILEEMHAEVYGRAAQNLQFTAGQSPAERTANAILDVCALMEQSGMIAFWENDLPVLLSKLPQDILQAHYHDDEVHILELLRLIVPDAGVSRELIAATVRTLMLTIAHRSQIGERYHEVLELLVRGACDRIFASGA